MGHPILSNFLKRMPFNCCLVQFIFVVQLGKREDIGWGPTACRPCLICIDDSKRLSGSPLGEVYGSTHDI